MSVPANERSHGKLEASVKANALCCYTLQITANEKVFDPQFQASLTNRIVDTAISIHTLCWSANNVLVNSKEDLRERTSYQEQAAVQCNVLLSLIEIAKKIFHLSTKRVTYWSGLAIDARNLIRGWRTADLNRYAYFK